MKRVILKVTCLLLVMSMALSFISCGKKSKTSKEKTVISEDDPWFTSSVVDCESGAAPDKNIEYLNYKLAGADDRYYVVFSRGRYTMPPQEEMFWHLMRMIRS